jgi:hypothetical protein
MDRSFTEHGFLPQVTRCWAEDYINKRVADPRGTGGTPYMQWLRQLIAETRAHKT